MGQKAAGSKGCLVGLHLGGARGRQLVQVTPASSVTATWPALGRSAFGGSFSPFRLRLWGQISRGLYIIYSHTHSQPHPASRATPAHITHTTR
jgi:hypothetical protein